MSRIAWLLGLGVVAMVAPARADPALAQSVEAPVATPAAPAPDVVVTPFRPLTDAPQWAWAGRAVQQNMAADLARSALRPVTVDADPDPLAAARSAGARFVVTGTYQFVDPKLRFDGQVTSASTGAVVGVLSVTGDGRDLFAMEDDLSAQLAGALTRAAGRPAHTPATRPVPAALRPDAVAAAIAPPAASVGSAYDGSALQSYVDANRTPSVDYNQQLANARQQNTFGTYNSYGGPNGAGYVGFGGYGYGGGGYLLGVSYPIASGGSLGYGGIGYSGGFRGGFAGGRGNISVGFGGRGGLR